MKLTFNLVWIDDQDTAYLKYEKKIREHIRLKNHVLDIRKYKGFDDFVTSIEDKSIEIPSVDLIMTDYNLTRSKDYRNGEYQKTDLGSGVIQYLRENNHHTEILLYSYGTSSPPTGEDMEFLFQFDRISKSFSSNEEDILEKAKYLIDVALNKNEYLNNVRGLMMAATSNHEIWFEEAIKNVSAEIINGGDIDLSKVEDLVYSKVFNTIEESYMFLNFLSRVDEKVATELSKFTDKIVNTFTKQAIDQKKLIVKPKYVKTKNWENAMLLRKSIDFSMKVRILQQLLIQHPIHEINSTDWEEYFKLIVENRNILALKAIDGNKSEQFNYKNEDKIEKKAMSLPEISKFIREQLINYNKIMNIDGKQH